MSEQDSQQPISKRTVLYELPGAEAVIVEPDVEYSAGDGSALTMDVYRPADAHPDRELPAVLIVAGFPDPGYEKFVGCRFKDTGSSVSWARLIAASGMVAVTYANREPEADLDSVLAHLAENAAALGIDAGRLGLWASSSNVPLALSALIQDARRFKCAALCYGFMLDADGSDLVAEAAKMWRFANPAAGREVEELPGDMPLFVVRAGRDETPHLNQALDLFVAAALRCNLPVTLVNHPSAPHAFDLFDDSDTSRDVIAQVLAFLSSRLG